MNKLLYFSSVDISLPTGPSVNERTFLNDVANKYVVVACTAKEKSSLTIEGLTKYSLVSGYQRGIFHFFLHEFYKFVVVTCLMISGKWDGIVTRLEPFPFATLLITRVWRKRVHIKTVGAGLMSAANNRALPRIFDRVNKWMIYQCMVNAKSFDTVSERFYKELKEFCPKAEGFIVDNGVDTNVFFFRPESKAYLKKFHSISVPNDRIVIGYAGTHAHMRGGNEICDAIESLNKENATRKYFGLILGANADEEWIAAKKKLPSYGIDFVITEAIAYEQVPYFISSFDIGVSLLSEKYRGASCQKVRQYIACNTYTISTPGQENFIYDYGVGSLVENNSADELSKAVIEYLKGPNKESFWNDVLNEIAYVNVNDRRMKKIFK